MRRYTIAGVTMPEEQTPQTIIACCHVLQVYDMSVFITAARYRVKVKSEFITSKFSTTKSIQDAGQLTRNRRWYLFIDQTGMNG